MGCFNFVNSWYVKRKERRKERRRRRKQAQAEREVGCPIPGSRSSGDQDEACVTRRARGGLAFDVGFEEEPRRMWTPPPRPKPKFLDSAEERAILADIKRQEALLRKGDAARLAEKKREEYSQKRAEREEEFRDRAQAIVDAQKPVDQEKVKANLARLHKRCKTARRRRQVTSVLAGAIGPKETTHGDSEAGEVTGAD